MGNHEKFKKNLKKSTKALFVVAEYFHKMGYNICINGQKCAPTASNHERYADDGDLYIQTKDHLKQWMKIEVKGLSAEFTNSKDWPFGLDFMVCAKHSHDKKIPNPPNCYYILDKTCTHAGVVKTDTFNDWFTRTKKCGNYKNVSQEFYYCPLDKIEWLNLASLKAA
tara:strand:- start:120 stop:620 length:501 start_codon:yes stop_codon:yes gene_type:complete